MKIKKSWAIYGVIALIVFSLWQRRNTQQPHKYQAFSRFGGMDVLCLPPSISTKEATGLWQDIQTLLASYEAEFSYRREDSPLAQFNRRQAHEVQEISSRFYALLQESATAYQASEGYFDPSIYPLLALWGFAKDTAVQQTPDEEMITQVKSLVGFHKIHYYEKDNHYYIEKTVPGFVLAGKHYEMGLDFGAILKGKICDEVKELFMKHHIAEGIFQCGISSTFVAGTQSLSLQDPQRKEPLGILHVKDGFVSASGDSYRYREYMEKRYSHLLDPHTGKPVENGIHSAVVQANKGSISDAFATYAAVSGKLLSQSLFVRENSVQVKGLDFELLTTDYRREGE